MSKVDSDGVVHLYVDLTVTLAEMKTWQPERIWAFFDGLAKVRTAANHTGDGPAAAKAETVSWGDTREKAE
jgi:hypothetical protein